MLKPEATPFRTPVYKNTLHFIKAHLRIFLMKLFQTGMRDCAGRQLVEGDRVLDLNGIIYGNPSSNGVVISDDRSISGLSVLWDNNEVTQLIESSMLLKKNKR